MDMENDCKRFTIKRLQNEDNWGRYWLLSLEKRRF